MAGGKNKTATIEPVGICRVVVKEAIPKDICDGSRAHRHARMTAVGFLHGIDREEADGVDTEVINF